MSLDSTCQKKSKYLQSTSVKTMCNSTISVFYVAMYFTMYAHPLSLFQSTGQPGGSDCDNVEIP
jgi:hypothetical protein